MDITLAMLLYLALPEHITQGTESRETDSLPVRGIRIYDGAEAAHTGEPKPDLLYIKKQKNGVLLMLGGCKISIETIFGFAELFNKFEAAFITLRDWDMNLHLGIIENKGLQYMIDVSEDLFRRPMMLTDSGYKTVAYSKNWTGGDKVFHDAIEKGYLPSYAMEGFDRAGYIIESEAIVYRNAIDNMSFPMLNGTVVASSDRYYAFMLVMLFPERDYSSGISELFAALVKQLCLYAEVNRDAERLHRYTWVSLLADLIDKKCSTVEFNERNRYSGMSENLTYRLVSITREDGTFLEYVRKRIESLLPTQNVFLHNDYAHILLRDDNLLDTVKQIAAESKMVIGVSRVFHSLLDIGTAYAQTTRAIRIGMIIGARKTLAVLGIVQKDYDEAAFMYDDYFPYDLILPETLPTNMQSESEPFASGMTADGTRTVLSSAFREIFAEDLRTGSGNLRIIYSYLKNDCSKTKTSQELFMHRNNIVYRIDKIEENFGLSLTDERTKTALRMSFLAVELLDPSGLKKAFGAPESEAETHSDLQ